MEEILSVAFVLAATAFFKEQLKLPGRAALAAAFAVSLAVAFVPVIAEQLPESTEWVYAARDVVVLFLGAAGGYDLLADVRKKA